jgi:hypothetical protein
VGNLLLGYDYMKKCLGKGIDYFLISTAQGSRFSGLKNGTECWCSDGSFLVDRSFDCNTSCPADEAESCGGSDSLRVVDQAKVLSQATGTVTD